MESKAVRVSVLLVPVALAGLVSTTVLSRPVQQHPSVRQGHLAFEAAPDQAYLDERFGPGSPPIAKDAFQVIGKEALGIRARTLASDPSDAGQQWSFDGPTNIDNPHGANGSSDGGGRVTDVAVDPNHAGTVYIATATGGVWKTTDGGTSAANMTSVWPINLPQAIGAIAVGPDGTVFAGTGETNPGGGSITFYGGGIYRSSDGGTTWTNIGLTDSWTIGRIVIDPRSTTTGTYRVWVAASGNLFLPGHERGLYVTTNGLANTGGTDDGVNWALSLGPGNDTTGTLTTTTGAVDLAIGQQHPGTSPDTIYAAMWDHQRSRDTWAYTGPGSSVWKTTNGGATWTDLTSPTNALTDGLLADHNTDIGRIGVAVAPSNDSDVYVNYANETEGAQAAFFTSTNGGSTFTEDVQTSADFAANVTAASYVYGWWFAKVFVDPANPLHVFITGLCLWQSTDGASTVSNDCNVHADQHAMAWDPNIPGQAYLGDDGGFYHSPPPTGGAVSGAIGSFIPAPYEPWTQFDGLDVSEQNPARIIGGLQDNGSQRNWDKNGNPTGTAGWNSVFGGDGQQNLIDPANQDIVFSCLQYGVCQVSTDGGNTGTEFDTTPLSLNQTCTTCTQTTRNAYFTPMAFDPANPSIVYYGGDEINESQNDGSSWSLISSNLGGPNTGTNTDPLYAGHFGAATTIAISQSNDNIVWIGTDSGCIWYTQNALADNASVTWTEVSGPCGTTSTPPATPLTSALPTQFVSKVLIDPTNPQVVFVAFSGYRSGDNTAFVERTNDGGATWTNLSGDLPEVTVNSLALVNGRLYAANDTGVYVSAPGSDVINGTFTWDQLGNNLPGAPATMLRYVPENSTLYVSTFGRGVWSLSLSPSVSTPEVPSVLLLTIGGVGIASAFTVMARRRRRAVS
jgi:hypothetical protein